MPGQVQAPQGVLAQELVLPNGTVLKNRLVKSAMSEALATKQGAPTAELVRLYSTWAQGGVGLCVTGNVTIDSLARGEPGNVVIEDESHLTELRGWAQAATRNATACWVQLFHPGRQAPKGLNAENVAPSAVAFRPEMQPFFPTPRELTGAEVDDLIARFGRAAGIVERAGFSGVQLHAAHGYLLSQFLSARLNQRTDAWGGTPERRRRFVLAALAAVRSEVAPGFPIGIKLNSADFQRGGFTEEESLDTIRALADAGIDLIEISGGTYEAPAMTGVRAATREHLDPSTRQREAYFLDFAERARLAVSVPLVLTGGFRTLEGMAEAITSGAVDLVGIARPMALEPDLPSRLLAGKEPRHPVRPIRTGIPPVDHWALMEVAWYTGQLQRMGRGEQPRPQESPLWVFLKYSARQAHRRGSDRLPARLRAS